MFNNCYHFIIEYYVLKRKGGSKLKNYFRVVYTTKTQLRQGGTLIYSNQTLTNLGNYKNRVYTVFVVEKNR
jgi:hypothetical protein